MEPTEQQLQNRQTALAGNVIPASTLDSQQALFDIPDLAPLEPISFDPQQAIARANTLVQGMRPEGEADLTRTEGQISDVSRAAAQKETRRAQLEQEKDIPALTQRVTDLSNTLNMLDRDRQAIPIALQEESLGRGRTAGGIEPIEQSRLRTNAIQTLSTAAALEATTGNLNTAISLIDRAVNAEFAPLEAELNRLREQRNFIADRVQRGEVRLSNAQSLAMAQMERDIQVRDQQIETAKEQRKGVQEIMATAASYGADSIVLEKIKNAKTVDDAIAIAGKSLQNPEMLLRMRSLEADITLKALETQMRRQEIALLKQGATDDGAIIMVENALVMDDTLTALASHSGLSTRVGATPATRSAASGKEHLFAVGTGAAAGAGAGAAFGAPFFGVGAIAGAAIGAGIGAATGFTASVTRGAPAEISGAADDFAGTVQNLQSQLTLENLIKIKERGATFGNLSDGERREVATAASKLAAWEIKETNPRTGEKEGAGVWDIDEGSFKRELGVIQDMLRRDISRRTGSIISPEEDALLNQFFSDDTFSADNYY